MEVRYELRSGAPEFHPQQLPEEGVISVPLAARIKRDEEEVRAIGRLELLGAVRSARHRFAQRGAHPLEDRGAEQELALLGELVGEHFVEVVTDLSVGAGERRDEGMAVLAAPNREGRQLQPRCPPSVRDCSNSTSPGSRSSASEPFRACAPRRR